MGLHKQHKQEQPEKVELDILHLQKEFEEYKNSACAEKAEFVDTLKRLQAEFENFRKREEKERASLSKTAERELIQHILPVMDNFEIALKHKDNKEEYINGTELIFHQLMDLLHQLGLIPIKTVGEKFDPYKHEAVAIVKSDTEDNIIVEETRKGYMMGDFVLRTALVKVTKKSDNNGKHVNNQTDTPKEGS